MFHLILSLILFLAPLVAARAQTFPFPGPGLPVTSAGPVSINAQCFALGANGGTTGNIDTTVANFIAVTAAWFGNGTLTDSKSNIWIPLTVYGSSPGVRVFYAENPTVGTGHNFTITGSGVYEGVCVSPWSGMLTSGVFDSGTDSGAAPGTTTCAAGSITPSSGKKVVIAMVATGVSGAAMTIGSSYTIEGQYDFLTANWAGHAIAHLIQTPNGSATNPTWTTPGTTSCAIAAFKAA